MLEILFLILCINVLASCKTEIDTAQSEPLPKSDNKEDKVEDVCLLPEAIDRKIEQYVKANPITFNINYLSSIKVSVSKSKTLKNIGFSERFFKYIPDGGFSLIKSKKSCLWYLFIPEFMSFRAIGNSPLYEDFKVKFKKPVLSTKDHSVNRFDNGGSWLMPVFWLNDKLIGFVHTEDHFFPNLENHVPWKNISVSYSSDEGRTWSKRERILSSHLPGERPKSIEWSGAGDQTVIYDHINKRWVAIYFDRIPNKKNISSFEETAADETYSAHYNEKVTKADESDLLNKDEDIKSRYIIVDPKSIPTVPAELRSGITIASSLNSEARPDTWFKLYNGQFSEPGMGGKFTVISSLSKAKALGLSLNWIEEIKKWVLLFTKFDNKLWMTFTSDLTDWTSPQLGIVLTKYPNTITYPTLLQLDKKNGREYQILFSESNRLTHKATGVRVLKSLRIEFKDYVAN